VLHPAVDLNAAGDAYGRTHDWFSAWQNFLCAHNDRFQLVGSAADVAEAKQSGRIGILLGMQNSDHFRTAADVRMFYGLGQRVSQLTYNEQNRIGYGCTARTDGGLTLFGADVVRAMNETGMIVDVSHAGEKTTLDTFAASKASVLITHSNCRALADHPRCKSDNVLRELAKRGGVMGLTSIRAFVSRSHNPTLSDTLDHFDHVVRVAGIEHAGIGSDADLTGGNPLIVRELGHSRRVYDLVEGLIGRNYTDEHIRQVLGRNFQRVFGEILAA
jgi:membrane dipeptidase